MPISLIHGKKPVGRISDQAHPATHFIHAEKGDVLYLVDGPEDLTLRPYQQDLDEQLKAVEKVMKKYRNALLELAK